MSGGQTPTLQAAASNLASRLSARESGWQEDVSQNGLGGQGAGIVPWQVLSGDSQADEQIR